MAATMKKPIRIDVLGEIKKVVPIWDGMLAVQCGST